MPPTSVDFKFQQIGATVPNLSNDARPIHFHPRSRPSQRTHQTAQVSLPNTYLKIKIVLPIPSRRRGMSAALPGLGTFLCDPALSLTADHQPAYHQTKPNASHAHNRPVKNPSAVLLDRRLLDEQQEKSASNRIGRPNIVGENSAYSVAHSATAAEAPRAATITRHGSTGLQPGDPCELIK